ncbi:MAG: nuclear transport factor 2 family protein [Deltaproteobacteria bacterium]
MITKEAAEQFAKEWIESWNRHDIDSILSHYAADVEFSSPFVVKLIGETSGTIEGKEELRSYFKKGLEAYPDLQFWLLKVLAGVKSVTLYSRSVRGMLAAEIMVFDGPVT